MQKKLERIEKIKKNYRGNQKELKKNCRRNQKEVNKKRI